MKTFLMTLVAVLSTAAIAPAGECCTAAGCADPGCCAPSCEQHKDCLRCPKCGAPMTCKLVCGTKEVKKTVWVVKCEPFCTTLPNCCDKGCGCCDGKGCKDCGCESCGNGKDCGSCEKCCDPCAVERAKTYLPPKCGKICCKKTLEKKEIVCKVPDYKCVPVCCHCGCGAECGAGCGEGATPAAQPTPAKEPAPAPAPAPAAQMTLQAPLPPVIGASYVR